MRSKTLESVSAAADLYYRGGKPIRVYYDETEQWGTLYSYPASGEGKQRVEAFLGFLGEITQETDQTKRLHHFLALLQSLLDSSSTELKNDVCNAVFNGEKAIAKVALMINSNTQDNPPDYQMAYIRYSAEINKPGVFSKAATAISSLWRKKSRRAMPEQDDARPAEFIP